MLRSKMFRGIRRLDEASRSAPAFLWGEKGLGVAILQAALIQLGHKLPKSMVRRSKAPDGILGDETFFAVKDFQSKHKLGADGIAGRKTIHAMDRLLPPAHPAPAVKPPPRPKGKRPPPVGDKPPPPGEVQMPNALPASDIYIQGTGDPVPKTDKGAGVWNSSPLTARSAALKIAINVEPFFYAATMAGIGINATRHLVHYFGNTGRDYKIDLEGMFADNKFARENVLEFELACIADYIDTCPPGTWSITCKQVIQNDYTYNAKEHSKDWFFAIGGYGVWTKAKARVPKSGTVHADIELKFFDRYNWDGGKKVEIAGIQVTDEFMGDFHREGLAKEFNCLGSLKRKLSWPRFSRVPVPLQPPGEAY